MPILGDRIYPTAHPQTIPKTMSLTAWSKRSPSNTSAIAFVLIMVIGANLYYRDRPNSEATNNISGASGDIALVNASPKVKAFLKTIRWAEGTDSEDGYRMMFTGKKFDGFNDHPRIMNCYKKLCADVAGAYMGLSTTYDRIKKKINLPDFSPKSQDSFAIELLKEHDVLGKIERDEIQSALEDICGTWSTIPCSNGKGNYAGQGAKPMPSLLQKYKESLETQIKK